MKKEFKIGQVIKIDKKYRGSIYSQLFNINALETTLTDISNQLKIRRDSFWEFLYGILPEGTDEYHISIDHKTLEVVITKKLNEFEIDARKTNQKILDFIKKAKRLGVFDND